MPVVALRPVTVLGKQYRRDDVIPDRVLDALGSDRVERCVRTRWFARVTEAATARPRKTGPAKAASPKPKDASAGEPPTSEE